MSGVFCVDEETEILTPFGWRRHDGLKEGELVYGYRRGALHEEPLNGVHRFIGPHEALQFSSLSFSMVVTPNHRCIAKRRRTYRAGPAHSVEAAFVPAAMLNGSHYLVRSGSVKRRPTLSHDLVRLCAWIFAEGTYRPGESIRLCQSKTANAQYCDEIAALVARCGGKVIRRQSEQAIWMIGGDTAALIRLLMPGKVPGPEFWRRLSPHQARLFLYEACRGDGNWSNLPDVPLPPPPRRFCRSLSNFFHGSNVRIAQTRPEGAEALHVIATLAGIPARLVPVDSRGRHYVSLCSHRMLTCAERTHREATIIDMAWCPQTPSGAWVARRRGHVFITGNSHCVDALAYPLAILMPADDLLRRQNQTLAPRTKPPRSWVGA